MSNVVNSDVMMLINADSNISARTGGAPVRPEVIEEMGKELTKVIEDFDRAVNVEVLRLAKETGKHAMFNLSRARSQ